MLSNKLIKPLLIGLIFTFIFSFIFLSISAITVTNLDLSDNIILILSLISINIGVLVGSYIAGRISGEKGFIIGAIISIIFYAILTLISFMFSSDPMTSISLIKLITVLFSSILGGILGVNFNKKRKF